MTSCMYHMQFDRHVEDQGCFHSARIKTDQSWNQTGRTTRDNTWCWQLERCEVWVSEDIQLTDRPLQQHLKSTWGRERQRWMQLSVQGGNCHRLSKQTNNQFPSSLSRPETPVHEWSASLYRHLYREVVWFYSTFLPKEKTTLITDQ